MGEKMKTSEKIAEFFNIYTKARHNRNASRYYKALYEFKKIELCKASKELDIKKEEIKELKDKIVVLIQENQENTAEIMEMRVKIEHLNILVAKLEKGRFKKGNIPWNKGKKAE